MAPTGKGSKRKAEDVAKGRDNNEGDDDASSNASSSDGSDPSFINVDFDFVSPNEIDEPALRRMLRQLFYTHANSLNLYNVTQRLVEMAQREQGAVGTVIKVEGDEEQQDPFGFVGAIRLAQSDAASKLLTSYFLKQVPSTSEAHRLLSSSSADDASSTRPYLFLHERFINLPAQTAPPLYRLVTEELIQSLETPSEEPTHVLFLSRVFSSDAYSDDEADGAGGGNDDEDDEDRPRGMKGAAKRRRRANKPKKPAAAAAEAADTWGHFRPEDTILERHASSIETYRFPPPSEAEESYESPLFGRVIVVEWSKVKTGQIWDEMDAELGAGAGAVAAAGVGGMSVA